MGSACSSGSARTAAAENGASPEGAASSKDQMQEEIDSEKIRRTESLLEEARRIRDEHQGGLPDFQRALPLFVEALRLRVDYLGLNDTEEIAATKTMRRLSAAQPRRAGSMIIAALNNKQGGGDDTAAVQNTLVAQIRRDRERAEREKQTHNAPSSSRRRKESGGGDDGNCSSATPTGGADEGGAKKRSTSPSQNDSPLPEGAETKATPLLLSSAKSSSSQLLPDATEATGTKQRPPHEGPHPCCEEAGGVGDGATDGISHTAAQPTSARRPRLLLAAVADPNDNGSGDDNAVDDDDSDGDCDPVSSGRQRSSGSPTTLDAVTRTTQRRHKHPRPYFHSHVTLLNEVGLVYLRLGVLHLSFLYFLEAIMVLEPVLTASAKSGVKHGGLPAYVDAVVGVVLVYISLAEAAAMSSAQLQQPNQLRRKPLDQTPGPIQGAPVINRTAMNHNERQTSTAVHAPNSSAGSTPTNRSSSNDPAGRRSVSMDSSMTPTAAKDPRQQQPLALQAVIDDIANNIAFAFREMMPLEPIHYGSRGGVSGGTSAAVVQSATDVLGSGHHPRNGSMASATGSIAAVASLAKGRPLPPPAAALARLGSDENNQQSRGSPTSPPLITLRRNTSHNQLQAFAIGNTSTTNNNNNAPQTEPQQLPPPPAAATLQLQLQEAWSRTSVVAIGSSSSATTLLPPPPPQAQIHSSPAASASALLQQPQAASSINGATVPLSAGAPQALIMGGGLLAASTTSAVLAGGASGDGGPKWHSSVSGISVVDPLTSVAYRQHRNSVSEPSRLMSDMDLQVHGLATSSAFRDMIARVASALDGQHPLVVAWDQLEEAVGVIQRCDSSRSVHLIPIMHMQCRIALILDYKKLALHHMQKCLGLTYWYRNGASDAYALAMYSHDVISRIRLAIQRDAAAMKIQRWYWRRVGGVRASLHYQRTHDAEPHLLDHRHRRSLADRLNILSSASNNNNNSMPPGAAHHVPESVLARMPSLLLKPGVSSSANRSSGVDMIGTDGAVHTLVETILPIDETSSDQDPLPELRDDGDTSLLMQTHSALAQNNNSTTRQQQQSATTKSKQLYQGHHEEDAALSGGVGGGASSVRKTPQPSPFWDDDADHHPHHSHMQQQQTAAKNDVMAAISSLFHSMQNTCSVSSMSRSSTSLMGGGGGTPLLGGGRRSNNATPMLPPKRLGSGFGTFEEPNSKVTTTLSASQSGTFPQHPNQHPNHQQRQATTTPHGQQHQQQQPKESCGGTIQHASSNDNHNPTALSVSDSGVPTTHLMHTAAQGGTISHRSSSLLTLNTAIVSIGGGDKPNGGPSASEFAMTPEACSAAGVNGCDTIGNPPQGAGPLPANGMGSYRGSGSQLHAVTRVSPADESSCSDTAPSYSAASPNKFQAIREASPAPPALASTPHPPSSSQAECKSPSRVDGDPVGMPLPFSAVTMDEKVADHDNTTTPKMKQADAFESPEPRVCEVDVPVPAVSPTSVAPSDIRPHSATRSVNVYASPGGAASSRHHFDDDDEAGPEGADVDVGPPTTSGRGEPVAPVVEVVA